MKKDYKEKLKVYSALAGGIALATTMKSEAQVVYHDISPDTVANATHSSYGLDFNNDGIIDITLVRRAGGPYTSFYTKGNGQTTQINNYTRISNLSLGDTISSSKSFGYWTLGKIKITGGTVNTNYAWLGGETDKYIGVNFTISSVNYYGWIRVSLAADFSVLTIKDYAYESSPRALIKVGAVSSVPAVTGVIGIDGGNANNASDLSVGFSKASSETNIAHYRVFVAPTNPPQGTLGFNLDTAQMTVAARYYDIAKTGSNIAKSLPASLLDIYGNTIVNGTPYTVYVMSVGNASYDDALEVASSSITLEPSVVGATTVVATDIANNGNASDMKVTFTKASSEMNVSSYAVLVVPYLLASSTSLSTAQAAVMAGNYTTVAKTGSNLSVVLSPTAKDVTGASIVQGTSYEVFILTIAAPASSLGDSLSLGSAAVTLSGATAINDAQFIKAGISSFESTVNLQNMPSEGTIAVSSTTGAQVYTGAVAVGDNTYSLSYVKTGIYIVNLIFQDQVISKQVYISGK